MHTALLITHISTAVIALIAGAMAMVFRKGSNLHGATGTVFFGSMLLMTSTAAYLAAFVKVNMLNLVVGLLTFYMVVTAWRVAKRRDVRPGWFDLTALLFVLGVSMAAITFGIEAAQSTTGKKNGAPAMAYFIFGTIALLFTVSDVRMFRRGGLFGSQRIARHLWRMSFALLLVVFSFFPGQARQFPQSWRHTPVIYIPHVLLIVAMIYWKRRYSQRKRVNAEKELSATHGGIWTPRHAQRG
jgi:uncharacterized membrane protein